MLPTESLARMREGLERREEAREQIIKRSRTVQRASKQAIFTAHEGKQDAAKGHLEIARAEKEAIERDFPTFLESTGSFAEALEEYAEAALLLAYLRGEILPDAETLGVSAEAYVGGLADLAGELARVAVFAAMRQDSDSVRIIWETVSQMQQELAAFHLRGNMRKKYDGIKYHLQKIEQILYDLRLRAQE